MCQGLTLYGSVFYIIEVLTCQTTDDIMRYINIQVGASPVELSYINIAIVL